MMACNTKINTIYSRIETAAQNGENTRGLTVELNKELATLKKAHEALKKGFERRYKEIRAIEEENSLKSECIPEELSNDGVDKIISDIRVNEADESFFEQLKLQEHVDSPEQCDSSDSMESESDVETELTSFSSVLPGLDAYYGLPG